MPSSTHKVTRWLTLRYVFALGLVGGLSVTNFWLLRAEMQANEASVELLTLSGRQRTLLQSTSLLAQAFVSAYNEEERAPILLQLTEAINSLERAHHRLVEFDPTGQGHPPTEVQEIYESSPWLLDTEIRNYLTQLRELARSDEQELSFLNPHYRYVREVALKGEVMEGLEQVVKVYRSFSDVRAVQLHGLAQFSLVSTLIVLMLSGVFVFRPMVKRVRHDMLALNRLNETLEVRVAERTAIAEQRACDLAASEALYHSLVETLPMGVARTDHSGRYTYVNKPFCEIVGKTRSGILGFRSDAVFEDGFSELIGNGEPNSGLPEQSVQRLTRTTSAKEDPVIFEILEVPVRDRNNLVVGTQTLIWDITERKAAEERMLQAERLAAIGEMMTGVAHESRNALQQINACAKMLEWDAKLDGEARGLIFDIQKAHDRLHRLFENLRGYASPLRVELRPVLMADVFGEAWKSTLPMRAQRQVRLTSTGAADQTDCLVDTFQFEQVFRNILENSLSACFDPVEIEVRWFEEKLAEQPAVGVSIVDNGPGLSREVQQRIFDPFFTTRTRGTGLGMAIVWRIVHAHGGQIQAHSPANSLENSPGTSPGTTKGTEIRILIPKGRPCNENSPSPSPTTNHECESSFAKP